VLGVEVEGCVRGANFEAPLIIVLAGFTLIGMLIGYIGPVYRRHRREEKRSAGKELEKKGIGGWWVGLGGDWGD
jgi:hypothetical protein